MSSEPPQTVILPVPRNEVKLGREAKRSPAIAGDRFSHIVILMNEVKKNRFRPKLFITRFFVACSSRMTRWFVISNPYCYPNIICHLMSEAKAYPNESGKNLRPARPSGAGGRESSRDSFPPGTSLKHSYLVHLKETSMRE